SEAAGREDSGHRSRERDSTLRAACARGARMKWLDVVIQVELVRVRADLHWLDFSLSLVGDPGVDQIFREDTAAQQERLVGLEGIQHFAQASRRRSDSGPLFPIQ